MGSLSIPEPTDMAYIAGFIDADGYITIDKQKRQLSHHRQPHYYTPRMGVCNRNYDLLEWINATTGSMASFHKRSMTFKKAQWSDCWWLGWTSKALEIIIPQLLPYLKMKDKQAKLALEMIHMKRGTMEKCKTKMRHSFICCQQDYLTNVERYEEIYRLVKSYNKTGPEYLVNNGVNSGNAKSEDMPTLSRASNTLLEGAETTGGV